MTWGKDISSTGKNKGYRQETAWTVEKHQWINVGMQTELERHWKRKQLTQRLVNYCKLCFIPSEIGNHWRMWNQGMA